ncbi:unnamed protein product, partial [Symbiodinium microadriaticum]
VIWSFWDGKTPVLVERCLESWRRQAKTWQIRLLNRSSALSFLGYAEAPVHWTGLSAAGLSDLIRTEVVAEHGGVWLDATIALQEPLESWVSDGDDGSSLVGFDTDFAALSARRVSPLGRDWERHFHRNGSLLPHLWHSDGGQARYFESWAFAAPRGCTALRAWRDELRRAAVQGFAAYCADIMAEPEAQTYLHPSLREWLPYLAATLAFVIHATLARVRYLHPVHAVRTLPAESTGLAHSNYAVAWTMAFLSGLTDFALDGTGGPLLALARSPGEVPPPPRVGPLVKLRGLERVAFDCVLFYQGYAGDSPLAQLLNLPPPPRWWPQKAARFLAALEARFGPTDDKALLILFWLIRRAVSWHGIVAVGLLLAVLKARRKEKAD